MREPEILVYPRSYGRTAQEAYDYGCVHCGFKPNLRTEFVWPRLLYAKDATLENYSVWMVPHSNRNEEFTREGKWYNIFESRGDIIKEIWFKTSDPLKSLQDNSYRLCFAYCGEDGYVFQGIYEPIETAHEWVRERVELVRTFRRISKTYPIQKKERGIWVEASHVVDGCKIEAKILEQNKLTEVFVNLQSCPGHESLLDKAVGDTFALTTQKLTYQILKILVKI